MELSIFLLTLVSNHKDNHRNNLLEKINAYKPAQQIMREVVVHHQVADKFALNFDMFESPNPIYMCVSKYYFV